ncbi:MAG: PhzF family phenazine biosynthesis protein [Erysipelotrichaceae bacterium]|nr:PhzF family phenazine biosynthesis protein [Erysipelotrichaceae bacterium]
MKQYIVDAFTDTLFKGNQAAVCVMDSWPEDKLMENIAKENNFSETAFTVKEKDIYNLRWFTPSGEVDFCGHATLGTSFVLFNYYEKDAEEITFMTQKGRFTVTRDKDLYVMNFPAYTCHKIEVTDQMAKAIGVRPLEAYIDRDLLLVLSKAEDVFNCKPDQDKVKQLDGLTVAVTAPSDDPRYDSVSRVFVPKLNIPEDPVTGSTHCLIAPYWSKRLNKKELVCYQASERSGILYIKLQDDRVSIAGNAVLYSVGDILQTY